MPVYKEKNGKWYFKVSVKGRQFLRRGFSAKQKAKEAELLFIFNNQKESCFLDLTFNDVAEMCLDFYKQRVKISSYKCIFDMVQRDFIGIIPNVKLSKLLLSDFMRWRQLLIKKNLKSYGRQFNFLNNFYDYCNNFLDVDLKFVKRILPIRIDEVNYASVNKQQKYILSDDLKKFLKAIDDSFWSLLFLIPSLTGIRIGELRAIQPRCIIGDKLFIFENAVSKSGQGKTILVTTKSKKSNRDFVLPRMLIEKIKEHISKNKLRPEDFIFFSVRSKTNPISESEIKRKIVFYCEKAKINYFNFHMFRHTVATILSEKGFEIRDIENYLGHSSGVTETYYIHRSDEKKKDIISFLDEVTK